MDAVYDNYLFAEPCSSQFSPAGALSSTPCLSSPSSGYCSADEGLGSDLCSGVRRSYSGVSLSNSVVNNNSYLTDGGCGWQGVVSPTSFVLSTRDPCLSEHILATAFGSHSSSATRGATQQDSSLSNSCYTATFGADGTMTDSLFDQFSGGVSDVEMRVDFGQEPPQPPQRQKTNFSAAMARGSYITTDHGYVTPSFGCVGGGPDVGLRELLRSDDDDDVGFALNSFPLHQRTSNDVFMHRNKNNNNNNGGGLLSGFHQPHMAGFGDISTGDTGDYDLDFVVGAMSQPVHRQKQSLTAAAIASQTGGGAASGGGGGSGSTRLMQLRSVNSARFRNVPVGRIGSLLTNASHASHAHGSTTKVRSSSQSAAATASAAAGGPTRGQRVVGMRTSMSSSRLIDVRGGRPPVAAPTNPTYPGLDDHRYTTKVLPPSQQKVQSRSSRPTHGGMAKSSSTSRLGSCGGTSILEMFLLSSRPVDPNKGSTAALATEGLLGQLHINTNNGSSGNDCTEVDEEEGSETLLKMLLTGKIDQNDVNRDRQREISGRSNGIRNSNSAVAMAAMQTPVAGSSCTSTGGDETMKTVSSVDSLLSYGFQLEELDVFNDDDGVWMSTTADVFDEMLISDELDEILREQSRQDELLLQHYGTEMS